MKIVAPALITDDLLDFILVLSAVATPAAHCWPPDEVAEAKTGLPLTHDDLLDFMLLLGSTDFITTEVMLQPRPPAAG